MKELEHDYFHHLYRIAIEINSAGSVQGVLKSVVENTTRTINAKGCSIMLFAPNHKSLIHTISFGLSQAFIEKGPRTVAKSLPETVTGEGHVSIVHDLNEESSRVEYPDAAKKEGITSIMAVPMTLKGNIIGELRCYTAEKHDFTEDEVSFVQAVADLGALALDNARMHEATEKAYRDLSTNMGSYRFW